jgi:hypothetical protein
LDSLTNPAACEALPQAEPAGSALAFAVQISACDQAWEDVNLQEYFKGISKNSNFGLMARHAKKITAGIWFIFRGLFFEHNAAIRLLGNF